MPSSVAAIAWISATSGLIHAIAATEDGMLLLDHMEDDALLALASRTVVASTERIVTLQEFRRGSEGVILQGIHVTALVEAPGGALPTLVRGAYALEADRIREYIAAATDDATFKRYLDRHIYG